MQIKYVALGDSYTICEGSPQSKSWPVILTEHLNVAEVDIKLVANPSVTGYTTHDVITKEYPVFDASNADFVTLCIGVNDWVRGSTNAEFKTNLIAILDHVQEKLGDKSKLILLTIPDFSVTPTGKYYTNGKDASKGISEFNDIIKEQADLRKLKIVDLFEPSKAMGTDSSLVAGDGLHPSSKEYAIWETLILPVA